jgi:uncharacterized protein
VATLRVIKEPIHNYISISALEAELISDPLFQRLHNISQNGNAYLTYPSNRTSRFVHSLGTMHLGGLILRSALFNSDKSVKSALISAFREVMANAEADKGLNIRQDQIETYLQKSSDIFYRNSGFDPENASSIPAVVMFQSVRIACVLHDLGHPPFSHTTEMVMKSEIQSYVSTRDQGEYKRFVDIFSNLKRGEGGQLHEKMGTELTDYVFSNVTGDIEQNRYGRFCFWIASRIANLENAENDPHGIFRCLHSIVSRHGFDADRGDYVLRDGYASSFEFGEYDLARVLDNLRFSQDEALDFELVTTTTATSALESFFLERYRIWRWLVFHHSVTRGHVALSRALGILFDYFFTPKTRLTKQEAAVRELLERFEFALLWRSFENPKNYRNYVKCDEHWLFALLRSIQLSPQLAEPGSRKATMLKVYLDYLLDRKKSNFRTLWKRAEEYDEFCGHVFSTFQVAYSKLTGPRKKKLRFALKGKSESATQWFNRLLIPVLAKDLQHGEIEVMRQFENRFQQCLGNLISTEGALLLSVLRFSNDIDCPIIDKRGTRVALQTLSSLVNDLPATWSKDIQLRAYWVGLKSEGGLFSAEPSSPGPSRERLASCTLEALLGGETWASLQKLLEL